ncbi:MAG: hypothetical protein Q4E18_05200 [Clostridia bacterium]|nr:hypothetical protein [Clostridia bacterium]
MEFADLLFTDCGQGTVHFFLNLLKMYTPCISSATSTIQLHVLTTVGLETAIFTIKAHSAARQFTNAIHQMTDFFSFIRITAFFRMGFAGVRYILQPPRLRCQAGRKLLFYEGGNRKH